MQSFCSEESFGQKVNLGSQQYTGFVERQDIHLGILMSDLDKVGIVVCRSYRQ